MFIFEVLKSMQARNSESFILYCYMKKFVPSKRKCTSLIFHNVTNLPGGGGGGLIYETDGDARRLA